MPSLLCTSYASTKVVPKLHHRHFLVCDDICTCDAARGGALDHGAKTFKKPLTIQHAMEGINEATFGISL